MPENTHSLDYTPIHIDDVNQIFRTILEKRPTFSSLVPLSSRRAKNHTHEWLEYKKAQSQWIVDALSSAPSTTLVFVTTAGAKVNDIVQFEKPDGTSTTVQAKVTAVNIDGVTLTIERLGVDEDILNTSIVTLVSRAKNEGSNTDLIDNVKPLRKENYTQIEREDFELTRTALQTAYQGLSTEADREGKTMELVEMQLQNALQNVAYRLNHSAISGFKEKRVKNGDNGTMGGFLPQVESDANSVLDAVGAAVDLDLLDTAVEQAVLNGADGPSLTTMVCGSNQARRISKLNVSGDNPVVKQESTVTGTHVMTYKSYLGGTNGGALVNIIVDRNFPKDKIVIFNPSNNEFIPMENFSVIETSDKEFDGRRWKVLGELTAEWRNANDEAIVIDNLAV